MLLLAASLWLLVHLITLTVAASDYFERLTLKPLPQGALLASFEFRSNESVSAYEQQKFRFFPRSLGDILQHATTQELHLRFSTGRWDTENWGARPWDGIKEGGTGVELWAWIEGSDDEDAFHDWTTLVQSLSGLFCASLNFIDSTKTTRPVISFSPQGDHEDMNDLYLLHGMLPGEVVCTENLTPFLKLLPCKGKAGISSLLDGHKVFDATWQTMSIDVRPKCFPRGRNCKMEISQTIDMVLDIERSKRPKNDPIPRPIPSEQLACDETKAYHSADTCYPLDKIEEPEWLLSDVFGRPMAGSCVLGESESTNTQPICLEVPHERQVAITDSGSEFKTPSWEPESRCYQVKPNEPFDMRLAQQKMSHPHDLDEELISAERTITGHGASHGGIQATITNLHPLLPLSVAYFESLPWFMRPYMHTLEASILHSTDDHNTNKSAPIIQKMFYKPSIDRHRGTQFELLLTLPPATTITLSYSFEKAILRYTEYPPDANRGFNVGPAVLRVLDQPSLDGDGKTNRDIYVRTTSLLLVLPTPDFSMPYNVIILTSTVMALAFGSIFNLVTRRIVAREEWPGSKMAQVRGVVGRWVVGVWERVVKGRKVEKVE